MSYNDAVLKEDFCFDELAVDCRDAGFWSALDLLAEKGTGCRSPRHGRAAAAPLRMEPAGDIGPTSRASSLMKASGGATFVRASTNLRQLKPIRGRIGAGIEKGPGTRLYVKNLFDVRGQLSKGIQCREEVCGDPSMTPRAAARSTRSSPGRGRSASASGESSSHHRRQIRTRRDMIAAGFILPLSFAAPSGDEAA